MDKQSVIKNNIQASIDLKQNLLNNEETVAAVEKVVNLIVDTYKKDGKVLFCGNGGSSADAQHLAAELTGRYYYDRPPLSAEALHVNVSYLTAVANDYSYEEIYARLVQGVAKKGDVLIGLSTSGNSPNVVRALKKAQELGCTTVGFGGKDGGKMKEYSDIMIKIDSTNTPRIQECHMLLGHSICELVEQVLFPRE